jgi:predicted esterase
VLVFSSCGDDSGTEGSGLATTTTQTPATTSSSTTPPQTASPPAPAAGLRYVDLVFDAVETEPDVVYWPDAPPLGELDEVRTESLRMDVHFPAGDTAGRRPVIMAFETNQDSWVVQDFVRRGYVVVTPEVRGRPSTPDLNSLLRTRQGMVDAAAAVRFLRANADAYGIHPDAIAATGFSGAGIVAFSLAWGQTNSPEVTELDLFGVMKVAAPDPIDWGDHHADQPSQIAAAFPLAAWFPRELVDPGEPPVIMFSGTFDDTYPFASVEKICPRAEEMGVTCVLRSFPAGHGLGNTETISVEAAAFLAEHMLVPAGLFEQAELAAVTPATSTLSPAIAVTTEIRPTGASFEPCDIAVTDSWAVYLTAGHDSLVRLEDDTLTPIPIEGLPAPTDPATDGDAGWTYIGQVVAGPGDRVWVAGISTAPGDDEAFGGKIEGWTGERRLAWIASGDCGNECTWTVRTGRDDPALAGEIKELTVAPDGTPYALGSDENEDPVLLVFTGSHWQVRPVGATKSLMNQADLLTVDTENRVWAAPSGPYAGVFEITGPDTRTTSYLDPSPGDVVRSLTGSPEGGIWVSAVRSGVPGILTGPYEGMTGVVHFDGDTWTPHTVADGLLSEDAQLAVGPDGTVWAIHDAGYSRYDGDGWTAYVTDERPSGGDVAVGPDGTVWVTNRRGVIAFDGATQVLHEIEYPD